MWGNSLEKAIILGRVSGKKKAGHQRTSTLMDTNKADTSQNIEQLKVVVEDQKM